MNYITHHRYRGLAACGEWFNIPYETELVTAGDYIVTQSGKPICYDTSETAKRHFARNNDGRGLERGELTYAIAYAPRRAGKGFRFTDEEQELLAKHWSHFLREDVETILFNEDFFAAQPEELKALAKMLHIKTRR